MTTKKLILAAAAAALSLTAGTAFAAETVETKTEVAQASSPAPKAERRYFEELIITVSDKGEAARPEVVDADVAAILDAAGKANQ